MLPSGHIAAGYLVAQGALHLLKPELLPGQYNQLLFWGAFFGFCPDLDMFYAFYKAKGFTLPRREINHRAYLTHRPMFWLAVAAVVYLAAPNPFWQMFALLIWLGTWSHFLLDSFKVGVQWLWPLTNRYFATLTPGVKENGPKTSFFKFWFWFLANYPKNNPVTFYLEVLILLTAAVVFSYSHLGL
jgi:hypothetical protein